MAEILLKVQEAHIHYGGVEALNGTSVSLGEGEIAALMGSERRTAVAEFAIMCRYSNGFFSG